MFRRLFGIKKFEESLERAFYGIKNCWGWITHLNEKNKMHEERIRRLEQANKKMAEALIDVFDRIQSGVVMIPKVELNFSEISEKDTILLKIMHQYAAFDEARAISTNEIYQNLTFDITGRGLRKKLEQMERGRIIGSVKKGNVRFWFMRPGNIARLKKAIAEEEE